MKPYLISICLAIFFALICRTFVIEAYQVPTSIMKPTLVPGDYLFALKWPFGLRLSPSSSALLEGRIPDRGEVVLFVSEREPDRIFVRRVLGMPGETVLIEQGVASINGASGIVEKLSGGCGAETHGKLSFNVCVGQQTLTEPLSLTAGPEDVVVVADDRGHSGDLEVAMKIPVKNIIASPWIRWLSIAPDGKSGWLPQFRFDRIFSRIR